MTFVDFLTHIVPSSMVDAFAQGEILQVVFFSVLFGVALARSARRGRPLTGCSTRLCRCSSGSSAIIMVVAPIGAFGAMAYTVGNFGVARCSRSAGSCSASTPRCSCSSSSC